MADYYVNIVANKDRRVLYIGVTNNLRRRMAEHKNHALSGFTARYNVEYLIYFEHYTNPKDAIFREKQLKAGSRAAKIRLVRKKNPKLDELDIDDKR